MIKVNIIVPIYREKLDPSEIISLKQLFKILDKHTITIIHPEKISLSFLDEYNFSFSSIAFKNEYFEGIYGYNKLTLSPTFYLAFKDYDFILIYQTDAYVFRDELIEWCTKDYDYIGGPWTARKQTLFQQVLFKWNAFLLNMFNQKVKDRTAFFKVGNGGFSLRKTKVFINLSKKYENYIAENVIRTPKDFIPEDVFWSLNIPNIEDTLHVPSYEEALKFGFDRRPHIAYKQNNNNLPFGAHGINRKNRINFFRTLIKDL